MTWGGFAFCFYLSLRPRHDAVTLDEAFELYGQLSEDEAAEVINFIGGDDGV